MEIDLLPIEKDVTPTWYGLLAPLLSWPLGWANLIPVLLSQTRALLGFWESLDGKLNQGEGKW